MKKKPQKNNEYQIVQVATEMWDIQCKICLNKCNWGGQVHDASLRCVPIPTPASNDLIIRKNGYFDDHIQKS